MSKPTTWWSIGSARRRPKKYAALATALAALLLVTSTASANIKCYGEHVNSSLVGYKGNQGIRTNPATINGESFGHAAQLGMSKPGDFVAVGTYKGAGTSQGNCPPHYSPTNWTGYYDRIINGVYDCQTFCVSCWVTGSNPTFELEYTACPNYPYDNRWVVYFATTFRGCIYGPSTGNRNIAGIETFTTPDANIDVKWTNMMTEHSLSNWFNVGDTRPGYAGGNYTYQYVSNSAWNTFFAPLN